MTQIQTSLTALRKQVPLSLRVNYGWLRRKLAPHRIWDNATFRETYDWLQESQWWSRDQYMQYQLEQVQALVHHAYENVPYYRRLFDGLRLKPADIASLGDLSKLPVLTKDDIRRHTDDLLARNVDRTRLRYDTTGGSTGEPLGVYHDHPEAHLRELAFHYRQWGWAGYQFGDRFATLARGTIPRFKLNGERACWDYSTDINELILSSTEMHEENLHKYVNLLRRFRPKFMCVYPSSAEILARFLRRQGIDDIKLDAVFSDAEILYPRARELVESQLGCKVFDHYGLTEYVADAVECEEHDGYHVNMEYGILELVDEASEPITEADQLGTVVGTGFGNYGMPLLRYLTSDLASFASGPCACGRDTVRIKEFRGRIGDFVVSNIGRLVPVNMLLGGHSLVWTKIREIKLRQEREGELTALVAKVPSFADGEVIDEVQEELFRVLDREQFSIRIEIVDSIPRTGARAKLALLEQKLPISFAELRQAESS